MAIELITLKRYCFTVLQIEWDSSAADEWVSGERGGSKPPNETQNRLWRTQLWDQEEGQWWGWRCVTNRQWWVSPVKKSIAFLCRCETAVFVCAYEFDYFTTIGMCYQDNTYHITSVTTQVHEGILQICFDLIFGSCHRHIV